MSPEKHRQKAEGFSFTYIPEHVAAPFREALTCYRNNLNTAFCAMCRITAQVMFDDLGEAKKLRIFDDLEEIAAIAELDEALTTRVRSILFDSTDAALVRPEGIDKVTAAVLLEIMKDMLKQNYVRAGRLRQVLRMRQFFADPEDDAFEEPDDPKVSPIQRKRPGDVA